ncbi:UvrD-helicase domain-containing protein [Sphingobacterium sp. UBA6645]|uniref:UvrD-helicase domain-containing protein n=1 Tax=Sphingobacterium sp. UBA6645 TaxID=1947511 RepID=UPI0025E0240A|nr:UvrD-helicase domain-containing protein [Sphingobacterium sp. UBA6645]
MTWVKRNNFKSTYQSAGRFFKNRSNYYKKEPAVKRFNDIFWDFDEYVKRFNQNYIIKEKERLRRYFDNIEGKALDDQQRTALLTDEYSNLIIAGAGSGKTLTILAKVKYLVEHKNVNPADILLLSFTKKTVDELNERFKKINLVVKAITFHRLGYDIIKKYYAEVPAVTNERTLEGVIKTYLEIEIFEDAKALEAFIQYIACYMNIPEDVESYDSLGEKLDAEKGLDFQTIRSKCESLNKIEKQNLDTFQGERVNSVEELTIANFLYLNGIDYEYEKPYPYGETMYRPDFYLKEQDIYLEHFGVDEHNNAKWLSPLNAAKYVEEMKFKRALHKEKGTTLIETYSYYNRDKVLIEKLTTLLENHGVEFKPRDPQAIYSKIISNNNNFGQEIIKLIESFINLSKSKRLDCHGIEKLVYDSRSSSSDFMFERQTMFLRFVMPILMKYDSILEERIEIDYNDMINKATDLIQEYKPNYSFKYIIIDEYQDISFARFNLIKEIRKQANAKLICVGDDWQSIYRFAGSDVSLFSNFGKFVGKHEKLLIEQTYRNSQSLIDISARFIQKNKLQLAKNPRSKKPLIQDPIRFVPYDEGQVVDVFLQEVQRLVDENERKSILVLGRHSFDINELIKVDSGDSVQYNERTNKLIVKGFEDVDIHFLTVHKSKGTEADNVIILNVRNHLLGFPNKMTDDPILSLLLSDTEDFRFAEERRLFYVALTRTKNKVVMLCPNDKSQFAEELGRDLAFMMTKSNGMVSVTHCPYCKTGKLVVRKGKKDGSEFLGCSNFPQCAQTFKTTDILSSNLLCSRCESGFMLLKKGKYGDFLGCTNYPRCTNTIKKHAKN